MVCTFSQLLSVFKDRGSNETLGKIEEQES